MHAHTQVFHQQSCTVVGVVARVCGCVTPADDRALACRYFPNAHAFLFTLTLVAPPSTTYDALYLRSGVTGRGFDPAVFDWLDGSAAGGASESGAAGSGKALTRFETALLNSRTVRQALQESGVGSRASSDPSSTSRRSGGGGVGGDARTDVGQGAGSNGVGHAAAAYNDDGDNDGSMLVEEGDDEGTHDLGFASQFLVPHHADGGAGLGLAAAQDRRRRLLAFRQHAVTDALTDPDDAGAVGARGGAIAGEPGVDVVEE